MSKEEKKDAIVKAISNKNIAEKVYAKIALLDKEGGLDLPDNYSAANALKSAWLMVQADPKLMACSDNSKANAFLDMVIQGLSPSKKQGYFIPYGKSLQFQRSYMGNVAVTKRLKAVDDVHAQAIYKDEEVEITIADGVMDSPIHKRLSMFNADKEVVGAYAVVHLADGGKSATIMTIDQIKKAWEQGPMKGNSPAHKNFTDEMAKKTVVNRACKHYFNTSDDSDILVESVNRTMNVSEMDDSEYEEVIENQIEENANQEEIDIEIDEPEEAKLTEKEKEAIEQEELDLAGGPGY